MKYQKPIMEIIELEDVGTLAEVSGGGDDTWKSSINTVDITETN